ncbi:helix-turn-helix domain-containing protein [Tistrella mobilis]|uniref:helix-turn-helix domain-containing protein n=1 Tax=Tistrella mobilis TaxID=171437 RepID=UPI000688B5C8|nr:helix-turn-helix domain-containing protein [Tistrella mobilis]
MAWQETRVMDERLCFVSACLEGGDSISELCRVFGISRKTGHTWLGRYRRDGFAGWRIGRGRRMAIHERFLIGPETWRDRDPAPNQGRNRGELLPVSPV